MSQAQTSSKTSSKTSDKTVKAKTIVRPYEAVIIMHPDANDTQQKELLRRNQQIIKSFSGQIHSVDTWGKRELANPIKKQTRGVYFYLTFEVQPDAIAELERTMRINEQVMRFVHIRLEDGTNITKHIEAYKNALTESANREREREAKFQARKAARQASFQERE